MQNVVATWIYLDSPEESSEYPQVGKSSHLPEFQQTYWRCVAVFFALSKRFNPTARHILFTNQPESAVPVMDGFDLRGFLQQQHVEVVTLPLTYQTPPGYFGKWRNQFYIFDVLQFIEANCSADTAALVLDSDCLIRASLTGLFADLRRFGLLTLPLPYTETHDINGLTREGMRLIYSELSGLDWPEVPMYWGGEIFAATYPVIQQINAQVPRLWADMLQRHANGQPKFNEEAHLLSYCYELERAKRKEQIGKATGLADGYIKRIWTAPHFNNVAPEDARLPIWHLPSEKTGGIALLFGELAAQRGLWTLDNEQLAAGLGAYVGIPRRRKWLNWRQRLRYSFLYRMFK